MDEDGTLVSMPSFNSLPEWCRTLAIEILRLWPELTRQTYWYPKQEDIWAAVRLVYSHNGEEVVELMPVIVKDMAHVLLNKTHQPPTQSSPLAAATGSMESAVGTRFDLVNNLKPAPLCWPRGPCM